MFMVLSSCLRVTARVHPVHAMNAEQHQTADLPLEQADGLEPQAHLYAARKPHPPSPFIIAQPES